MPRLTACLDVLIEHARALPPELFLREIPDFGHPSLRHQFVHVLSVETAWVSALRGVPVTRLPVAEHATLASVVEARHRVVRSTLAYLDGLSDIELNTEISRLPQEWIGPRRSPAFIILHVLTHAFHHKGQMAAMFRILGHPAPDTDLQR